MQAVILKGREVLVRPVEGLNAKQFRDPQPGATPSAALIMGILSTGQAKGVYLAGRAEDSMVVEDPEAADRVVVPEVADRVVVPAAAVRAVDSGGRITATPTMNSVCFIKGEKRIIDA